MERAPTNICPILHKKEICFCFAQPFRLCYLLLKHSLTHPNTQHSFLPSPKWWFPSCSMLGFHIFTLFLDTPSTFPHLHATNVLKTHKPNAISAFKLQISTANNVVNSLWFPLGNYCQPIQSTLTAPRPFFFCSLGNSAIGFTSQRLQRNTWTCYSPFLPVSHKRPNPTSSTLDIVLETIHFFPSPESSLIFFIISCLHSNHSLFSGFPHLSLVYACSMSHATTERAWKNNLRDPLFKSSSGLSCMLQLLCRIFEGLHDWVPVQQGVSVWPLKSNP